MKSRLTTEVLPERQQIHGIHLLKKRSGVANYGEDASAKVDVYSKESAEALKALVADTEKSILATKT